MPFLTQFFSWDGHSCFSMMLMIGSSPEWIYSHSGAGDLVTRNRENRYMYYVNVSFQVFFTTEFELLQWVFFPLTKMLPSFKLLVDSLSCYSCGQKPSFLSLSENHLQIDNLTLINWIMLDKLVSLFLITFVFLIVKVTMEFHIVHLNLVWSH